MATPGWSTLPSQPFSPLNSPVPQLSETTFAPSVTASLIAVPRSPKPLELASTSRMWHFGQIAETMSRSRDVSWAKAAFGAG